MLTATPPTQTSTQVSTPTPTVRINGALANQRIIECNGNIGDVREEIIRQVIRQNGSFMLESRDFHWSSGVLMFSQNNEPVPGAPTLVHKKARDIREESFSNSRIHRGGASAAANHRAQHRVGAGRH
jgi:hypothetical protein